MDELNSNQSKKSDSESDSSFQQLRMSGNEFQELEPQDPKKIQEIEIEIPEKSLSQSVIETYKMCSSTIRTLKTNLAYNIRHSTFDVFTNREKVILAKDRPVALLGRVYENTSEGKERFFMDFSNVIWLTYRSGIYGVESDAGWGCMIRVCQMVLAETFKRVAPEIPLRQIIDFFRETPQAYFSLTRICQKGDIKQRWTSSIEVFTLLRNMMLKFKNIKLSIDLFSCCIEMDSLNDLNYIEYPLLIFVSNRLGKNKFEIEFNDHILELMKIPYFVGALGGNGGEALYLVGHYAEKFIFMDPHYVQEHEEQETEKKTSTSTYFQSQPYSIGAQCLAPSIAFTFLVKNKEEYEDLLFQLYKLQFRHYPWVGLEISSEELKSKIKPEVHKDDHFEDIG